MTDTTVTVRTPLPASLVHASPRKRLWLGAAGVALFISTLLVGYAMAPKDPHGQGTVGLDFIAFYTAGNFVRDGRTRELYDLHAVGQFQQQVARANGVDLGTAIGPYWNPPFYAWTFAPIAKLPYRTALRGWVLFNVLCAGVSAFLLCRIVARARRDSSSVIGHWSLVNRHSSFADYLLVPVLMLLSTPFVHALSHAQNTCTSLLLVTGVALLWRTRHAVFAGAVVGLMFYKPQLAAVLAAVLVFDLGPRVLVGCAATGSLLLLATLALPGSLGDFLHRMPQNLHFVQCDVPYLWDRHVTFKAFWRLLIQGRGAGEPMRVVSVLATLSALTVGAGLLWAATRVRAVTRSDDETIDATARRDRLIAATIAATPLLMPFYFDYDQLLLAVPAVLFAADLMRRDAARPLPKADVWLLRIWPAHYVWLMLNPDIALLTHVNLSVPLLAAVACLLITRAARRSDAVELVDVTSDAGAPAYALAC